MKPALIQVFVLAALSLIVAACPALAWETTLDQAFAKALENNPSIPAMARRIEQARERVLQARAYYYPTLDADASALHSRYSDNEMAAGTYAGQTRETYDAFLNAKWVIFSGFSRKYRLKSAELDMDREEALKADTVRTLLEAVAQSFHKAQLALANKAIAAQDGDFYARQLADAKIKQEAGKGSLSDVLNFNTRMNQARIEAARYEGEYNVSRAALAALVGADAVSGDLPAPVFPADEGRDEMAAPDAAVYLEKAVTLRPDLTALRLALEKAEVNIYFTRARLFPEISLQGAVGADRTRNPRFEADDLEQSIRLNFSYPLYAGGGDRAALREARAAASQASWELKNLENQVASEIRQDCMSVISAQEQLRLYRENAELVKQNRDMVALEYQYGKTSLVNLNEVQNSLNETRQRIALSLVGLRQAWHTLRVSSGQIHISRKK